MSKHKHNQDTTVYEEVDLDNVTVMEPSSEGSFDNQEPVRVLDYIAMRNFLPSGQWIVQNVTAKGPGTRMKVAELRGVATSWAEKTKDWGDGKVTASTALIGKFEAQSFLTGEVMAASSAYLPPKWAKVARAALDGMAGAKDTRVKMVLTLGIVATGKPGAGYEWLVYTHTPDADPEMEELRMLSALKRPVNQMALPLPQLTIAAE